MPDCPDLGNGQKTVSRALLFRKKELTELLNELPGLCNKNSARLLLHTTKRLRESHITEFSPRSSVRGKDSLSSAFEAVLSETVFDRVAMPAEVRCDIFR